MTYSLKLRTQEIALDGNNCRYWKAVETIKEFAAEEIAIIVVDMWDRHWSAGATLRCGALAAKIDRTIRQARQNGVFIIHAPSETMDFYKDSLARKRAIAIETVQPDMNIPVKDYPLPVDFSGGGSDSIGDLAENTHVWTRQTDKIFIDEERDIISDDGGCIYSHLKKRGIKLAIYMGVHTNICILGRSFAIKRMLSSGISTALVRDLTDAMYDPEKAPYVSHEEGTRLVVEYIEKFYCPTLDSSQL